MRKKYTIELGSSFERWLRLKRKNKEYLNRLDKMMKEEDVF